MLVGRSLEAAADARCELCCCGGDPEHMLFGVCCGIGVAVDDAAFASATLVAALLDMCVLGLLGHIVGLHFLPYASCLQSLHVLHLFRDHVQLGHHPCLQLG